MVLHRLDGIAGARDLGQPLSTTHHIEGSLSPTKRDLHAPGVLVVAGPSGAGKSTFIDLLTKGQLPAEIIGRLPNDVERWPVVSAHDFRKANSARLGISGNANPNEGLIIHYDFTFPHRYGIGEFAKDPASVIFEYGKSTTIISIMPSHNQLVAQFGSRLMRHLDSKSPARRLWRHFVRIPADRVRTFFGSPVRQTSDLYAHPQWLLRTYRQWNAFLTSLLHRNPDLSLVHVEPVSDAPDGPSFKVQREDRQQSNEAHFVARAE